MADFQKLFEHINEEQAVMDQPIVTPPALRRIDFSKYNLDELYQLGTLIDDNRVKFAVMFSSEGKSLSNAELEQASADLGDAIEKLSGGQLNDEELANVEKSWDERDKTKPEGWLFYHYDLPQLKELQALSKVNPIKFKDDLGIQDDVEFEAAIIELNKVVAEYESIERGDDVAENKKLREHLRYVYTLSKRGKLMEYKIKNSITEISIPLTGVVSDHFIGEEKATELSSEDRLKGFSTIRVTGAEAKSRQSVVPAWMTKLEDGKEYEFLVRSTPFGNFWLEVLSESKSKLKDDYELEITKDGETYLGKVTKAGKTVFVTSPQDTREEVKEEALEMLDESKINEEYYEIVVNGETLARYKDKKTAEEHLKDYESGAKRTDKNAVVSVVTRKFVDESKLSEAAAPEVMEYKSRQIKLTLQPSGNTYLAQVGTPEDYTKGTAFVVGYSGVRKEINGELTDDKLSKEGLVQKARNFIDMLENPEALKQAYDKAKANDNQAVVFYLGKELKKGLVMAQPKVESKVDESIVGILMQYKAYCKKWDLDVTDRENYHNFMAEHLPNLQDKMGVERDVFARLNNNESVNEKVVDLDSSDINLEDIEKVLAAFGLFMYSDPQTETILFISNQKMNDVQLKQYSIKYWGKDFQKNPEDMAEAVKKAYAKYIGEGTWALPDTPEKQQKVSDAITKLMAIKASLYSIAGDDDIFDALDNAQSKLHELLRSNPTKPGLEKPIEEPIVPTPESKVNELAHKDVGDPDIKLENDHPPKYKSLNNAALIKHFHTVKKGTPEHNQLQLELSYRGLIRPSSVDLTPEENESKVKELQEKYIDVPALIEKYGLNESHDIQCPSCGKTLGNSNDDIFDRSNKTISCSHCGKTSKNPMKEAKIKEDLETGAGEVVKEPAVGNPVEENPVVEEPVVGANAEPASVSAPGDVPVTQASVPEEGITATPTTPEEAKAQIELEYPEEPLKSTALAFADSVIDNPSVYNGVRNLNWEGIYANGETVAKQAKLVGQYGAFDPSLVQRLVDKLGEMAKFKLSRDKVPVLYFTMRDDSIGPLSLDGIKELVQAKSATLTGAPGECKLVWN